MHGAVTGTDTTAYKGGVAMNIKLSEEMRDYFNTQLEYARQRATLAKTQYNAWNNAAYMEDSPALSITYTARAEVEHDEYLFWTSVVASLRSKLRII